MQYKEIPRKKNGVFLCLELGVLPVLHNFVWYGI